MAKKPIVGTITGVFDETLNGISARLLRRTQVGYTVELLESRHPFQKGDTVHLSPAELLISNEHTGDVRLSDAS
jgi:hypothetical protein